MMWVADAVSKREEGKATSVVALILTILTILHIWIQNKYYPQIQYYNIFSTFSGSPNKHHSFRVDDYICKSLNCVGNTQMQTQNSAQLSKSIYAIADTILMR